MVDSPLESRVCVEVCGFGPIINSQSLGSTSAKIGYSPQRVVLKSKMKDYYEGSFSDSPIEISHCYF